MNFIYHYLLLSSSSYCCYVFFSVINFFNWISPIMLVVNGMSPHFFNNSTFTNSCQKMFQEKSLFYGFVCLLFITYLSTTYILFQILLTLNSTYKYCQRWLSKLNSKNDFPRVCSLRWLSKPIVGLKKVVLKLVARVSRQRWSSTLTIEDDFCQSL